MWLRSLHARGVGNKPPAAKVFVERAPQQLVDHGFVEAFELNVTRLANDIKRLANATDHVGGAGRRYRHEKVFGKFADNFSNAALVPAALEARDALPPA
jgi:hypothetical protein